MIVVELRILLLYHQGWLLWIANSTPHSLHGQHLDLLPHSVTWPTLPKVYPILWFWNWSTRDFWVAKKISSLVWRITQGDFANLSAKATAICDPTRALFRINAISRHGLHFLSWLLISFRGEDTCRKWSTTSELIYSHQNVWSHLCTCDVLGPAKPTQQVK